MYDENTVSSKIFSFERISRNKVMCMSPDHSKTYTGSELKNYFHRLRLKGVLALVSSLQNEAAIQSYCDLGCSNGYVTSIIASSLGVVRCVGLDHSDNLKLASESYPNIEFEWTDLNVVCKVSERFDLVTCLETLEHVGDVAAGCLNICKRVSASGIAVISVPIEVGPIGVFKFVAKTLLFSYKLDELHTHWWEYFTTLCRGGDVGEFRGAASGFGTHFGFDWHKVDSELRRHFSSVTRVRDGTTMFFVCRLPYEIG